MVNLQAFISIYHRSSSDFMSNNMPSGAKKHPKGTEPESHQKAKCFSFQRQNVSFQKAKICTSSSSSSFLFFCCSYACAQNGHMPINRYKTEFSDRCDGLFVDYLSSTWILKAKRHKLVIIHEKRNWKKKDVLVCGEF